MLLPSLLKGQEYGYTRYDQNEGLAGSTVNCMIQDKDGFLWFGTETGLSRFDGTHFKNYSQQDGLPDDEIIKLFADSKGRVWIAPFKNSLCYYYKGKIYNQQNDTVLKKVPVNRMIVRFEEDRQGNILMQEIDRLHFIQTNGQVTTITHINGRPIEYISTISSMPGGGFWVVDVNRIYKWVNNEFTFSETVGFPKQSYTGVHITNNICTWLANHLEVMVTSRKAKNRLFYPIQVNN